LGRLLVKKKARCGSKQGKGGEEGEETPVGGTRHQKTARKTDVHPDRFEEQTAFCERSGWGGVGGALRRLGEVEERNGNSNM